MVTQFVFNSEVSLNQSTLSLNVFCSVELFCPFSEKVLFVPWSNKVTFRLVVNIHSSMNDLTQNWRWLTLSDREGPGCILTKDDSSNDFSIVTKFFTKRALNIDIIARTFNPLWRSRSGLKIKSLDDHIILFTFDNKDDVDRILSSELWSFDKHLVVLQLYEKETPIYDIKFERASFCVQLHGIPLRYMTLEVALKISNVIGEVSQLRKFKEADGGNFLRLKVTINLSLPLCCGHLISLEDGKQIWVSFKYEQLPNLCYWCDRLTHDDKDCKIWIKSEGTLKLEERQFGAGLRASTYVLTTKSGITVPGFYKAKKKANTNTSNSPMEYDTSGFPTMKPSWSKQ